MVKLILVGSLSLEVFPLPPPPPPQMHPALSGSASKLQFSPYSQDQGFPASETFANVCLWKETKHGTGNFLWVLCLFNNMLPQPHTLRHCAVHHNAFDLKINKRGRLLLPLHMTGCNLQVEKVYLSQQLLQFSLHL